MIYIPYNIMFLLAVHEGSRDYLFGLLKADDNALSQTLHIASLSMKHPTSIFHMP